ncbi:MAG: hypothetical protein H6733_10440 [Alphaproteobacteria bacterium]|nr:hypothetical protein [Alphaproteobacteria bacterium]
MRSTILSLVVLAVACGGPEAPPTSDAVGGPSDAATNEGKPFVPASRSSEAMVRAADQRETMRYVATSGEIAVELPGKEPVHGTLGLDLVAVNIGDIQTLAFPKGYVKFDPLSLQSDLGGQNKLAITTLFRRQGSPIQIFFQIDSFTELQGRLAEAGSTVKAHALGMIQVDDKERPTDFDVLIERPTLDTLTVEVPGFDVPLQDLGLTDPIATLWTALGRKDVPTVAHISGSVALTAFTGEQLPTFVRTPVTVATVSEIVEKIDREVDDYEAEVARMRASGVPEEVIKHFDRTTFEAQNAGYEEILRRQAEARKRGAAEADAQQGGR